jgi:hypothetical protein
MSLDNHSPRLAAQLQIQSNVADTATAGVLRREFDAPTLTIAPASTAISVIVREG